jgi:hypothetical protein
MASIASLKGATVSTIFFILFFRLSVLALG